MKLMQVRAKPGFCFSVFVIAAAVAQMHCAASSKGSEYCW